MVRSDSLAVQGGGTGRLYVSLTTTTTWTAYVKRVTSGVVVDCRVALRSLRKPGLNSLDSVDHRSLVLFEELRCARLKTHHEYRLSV